MFYHAKHDQTAETVYPTIVLPTEPIIAGITFTPTPKPLVIELLGARTHDTAIIPRIPIETNRLL